jgi:uncharacterized membrane protein YphA (DoxX/SURF4 family)
MGLVLAPAVDPLPDSNLVAVPPWSFAQRLAFRFVCAYFVLYILPFPVDVLDVLLRGGLDLTGDEPKSFLGTWVTKPYGDAWDKAVLWTGAHVFDTEITYRPLGSGDTTWNYVQIFLFAVSAAIVSLVWTLAATIRARLTGRWRAGYPVLHEWLRVYVRFYLGYQMVVYGSVKVFKTQFAAPEGDILLRTYGESSPMHLLWTFMGSSDAYTRFAGAGELIGGLLLCFRRTTLLGALVTLGVMLNVAALNYCYDVPVKLLSSHMVLMSVFLMAPDLPWLVSVFVFGRRRPPRPLVPLTPWRWLNIVLTVFRVLVVAAAVGLTLHGAYEATKEFGDQSPKPPLHGLWDVDEFTLDGTERPPLTTDTVRWHHVAITRGFTSPMIGLYPMKGYGTYYPVAIDTDAKTLTLTLAGPRPGEPPSAFRFSYRELREGVIAIDGELNLKVDGSIGRKKIQVVLRQQGDEKFLLKSRGFHWINELPYNRYQPRDLEPRPLPPPPKRD